MGMDKLQIERDAKNRAYAFILAMGLLNEFAIFCDKTQDAKPDKLCQLLLGK